MELYLCGEISFQDFSYLFGSTFVIVRIVTVLGVVPACFPGFSVFENTRFEL